MLERAFRKRWARLRALLRRAPPALPVVPHNALATFEADALREVMLERLLVVQSAGGTVLICSLELDGAEQLVSDAGVALEIFHACDPELPRFRRVRVTLRNLGPPTPMQVGARVRETERGGLIHWLALNMLR